jgi:hypothetical protein
VEQGRVEEMLGRFTTDFGAALSFLLVLAGEHGPAYIPGAFHVAASVVRVQFEVAGAQSFSGRDLDLVCSFDALHDMGDPLGAARHVREALADDGTWMIVL